MLTNHSAPLIRAGLTPLHLGSDHRQPVVFSHARVVLVTYVHVLPFQRAFQRSFQTLHSFQSFPVAELLIKK